MTCKHCGKDIKKETIGFKWWKHTDGFYNCDGYRGHSTTYAEPKETDETHKMGHITS